MDNAKQGGVSEIEIHYIKSTCFRVIHCDGAIGGITPRGLIHFSLFNERFAIPQVQTQAVEEQRLGDIKRSGGRSGIVREMEVDVVMNSQAAKELRTWLDLKIKELEKLQDNPGK